MHLNIWVCIFRGLPLLTSSDHNLHNWVVQWSFDNFQWTICIPSLVHFFLWSYKARTCCAILIVAMVTMHQNAIQCIFTRMQLNAMHQCKSQVESDAMKGLGELQCNRMQLNAYAPECNSMQCISTSLKWRAMKRLGELQGNSMQIHQNAIHCKSSSFKQRVMIWKQTNGIKNHEPIQSSW